MKKKITGPERRYLPFTQEMRVVEDDDKMIIEGYPIVYGVYADLWGFREVIRKGAATKALEISDEIVLWDHESSKPMARRKNGTLEVKEDDHGVFIRADVSKTVWGRDGYEAVKNKVIDKMSFAFTVTEDRWHDDKAGDKGVMTREVIEFAELYDYSPVSYPAYKKTSVDARSRKLAFQHKSASEASEKDGAAALAEVVEGQNEIARTRSRVSSYLTEGEKNGE